MKRETIRELRRSWLSAQSDADYRDKELAILIRSMRVTKKKTRRAQLDSDVSETEQEPEQDLSTLVDSMQIDNETNSPAPNRTHSPVPRRRYSPVPRRIRSPIAKRLVRESLASDLAHK